MSSLLNLFTGNNSNNEQSKNANSPSKMEIDGKPSLSLVGMSERINISCNANTQLHVGSTIKAVEETGKEDERVPLELSIAMDVSGSMSGDKIELCKNTLQLLATFLSPKDKVALTTFDSYVKSVTNSKLMEMNDSNKQTFENKAKKLRAGSSTNLSGGLMEAINVLKTSKTTKNVVKAVILLTDGHANVGISDMGKLTNIVKNELAGHNISLFTYGYGANHNVNALQQLAQASDGGAYYFVEKADNISSAIGDCLGGIMSVVAQNIVLEATPMEGVKIINCYEEKRPVHVSQNGVYQVKFGDVYVGERRDTIFEVQVDPCRCPVDNQPLVTFNIKYLDALNECSNIANAICSIHRVEDNDVNVNATNKNVSTQVARVGVAKALSEANKLADKNKLQEAKKVIKDAIQFAESMKDKVDSLETLLELMQDLKDGLKAMESRHSWNSGAGYRMKSKMMNHQMQRCSEAYEGSSNVYRTARKGAYARSMKSAAMKKGGFF